MKNQPQLSKEDFVIDYSNAYKEIDTNKKEIKHYISSEQINSKGQYLPIAGYDDAPYRKAPMVLFNHGTDALFNEPTDPRESLLYTIGTNLWVQAEGDFLKGKTQFYQNNDFAMDLFTAYEAGMMNYWSKRWRALTPILYDDDDNLVVNKWSMYEYSAVFIAADDGATTLMQNSINDFKSDIFKNYIKSDAFKNTVKNDDEVLKLKKEIELLKNSFNQLPTELTEYINNAVKMLAESNHKRFVGIAGDINRLAKGVDKMNSNMDKKILHTATEVVAGVISEATGKQQ